MLASAKGAVGPRTRIVAISVGVFASVMSGPMISIAFPELVHRFSVSYATLQWRTVAFFSVFAVGLPFFGAVSDRVAPRRQLFLGMALFCLSALGSGLTRSWPVFLTCQTLQGIADAIIVPVQMRLIRTVFPKERIGWAFAWFGAVLQAASLMGPLLGGVLLRYWGVGSIFASMTAVGIIAFAFAWFTIPTAEVGARAARLPYGSAVCLLAIVLAVSLAISETVGPNARLLAVALGLAAALLLVAFERRSGGREALFPAGLGRNRAFVYAALRSFLLFIAVNAIALFGPSYLREAHGIDPGVAGIVLLGGPILALFLAGVAGRVADTRPNAGIIVGIGLSIAGTISLAACTPPVWLGTLFIVFLLIEIGGTLSMPSLNKTAMLSVAAEETGSYMGIFQLAQFSSGAFAGALFGPVVERGNAGHITVTGFQIAMLINACLQGLALLTMALARREITRPGDTRRDTAA